MVEFTVKKQDKLSKAVLKETADISYSAVMKLLREKAVKVNGKRVKEDLKVKEGDLVTLYYTADKKEKYKVIYSDDNILVIDKKAGYSSESVFEDVKAQRDAFFIHRLDRNTSGLMIFALNSAAEEELINGFKKRSFVKYYLASVFGRPARESGVFTAYLKKDASAAEVKIYPQKTDGAAEIKTGYELLSYKDGISVLKVRLYTGKTHQIRAHLAYLGYPVVGDGKYGNESLNKKVNAKKQVLRACELTLYFSSDSPLYYLNGKTFTV